MDLTFTPLDPAAHAGLLHGWLTTDRARFWGMAGHDPAQVRERWQDLADQLEVHASGEEEIFYPALKEHPKAKEIVLEGFEEHLRRESAAIAAASGHPEAVARVDAFARR